MSCTYLAHHELESVIIIGSTVVFIVVLTIITITIIIITIIIIVIIIIIIFVIIIGRRSTPEAQQALPS